MPPSPPKNNEEGKETMVSKIPVDQNTPLWRHVLILRDGKDGGGNRQWKCSYCNKVVTGSYSKVKAHLLQIRGKGVSSCDRVTDEILEELKQEDELAELRKLKAMRDAKQKLDYVSLPPGSDLSQPKKRKTSLSAIERAFNVQERDEIDKECARMFYTAALPFNLVRNPHFRRYSLKLANSNLAGYCPPTYNRLRTTLLAQEKTHVDNLLQPIRDSWVKKGVSLCSDGWSDGANRPIINIMAASGSTAVFVDGVDASGVRKDADYIANIFIKAIEEVGERNVVQIVTDNGSNFKAAGSIIEAQYPHIFWTPCVIHCVNLALKSICEPSERSAHYHRCKWLYNLCADMNEVQKFIVTHHMVKTIFKNYSKIELLKVADTRFASHIIVAKRLRSVKDSLEKMVLDGEWRVLFRSSKSPIDVKAREIKEKILSDTWWDNLDYFLKFTEPIYEMIWVGDKDAPVLHLIYDMWDVMIEKVKLCIYEHEGKNTSSEFSVFFYAIQQVLESRWNKSNTPLHCLAHSLVPKYYSETWLKGGGAGYKRLAPHEDQEISENRDLCFQRLYQNTGDYKKVCSEYGAFSGGLDFFNQPHVNAARDDEEPLSWWANYGSSTPILQALAFKLLSQPASSSCCERNWSVYGNIQSVKRNRLSSSRANDLVFVHNNLRLLSRKEDNYKNGPTKFWDIGGDKFDVDGSICELANLSINDEELEQQIYDAGNEVVEDRTA